MTTYTLFAGNAHSLASQTDTAGYTLGVEFEVSSEAHLSGIWFYSKSGQLALPTSCALYDANAGTQISGSLQSSPSWSGAAGSGWVKCTYDQTLVLSSASKYMAVVFYGGGSKWYSEINNYWTTGGGTNGITNGILSAPKSSSGVHGNAVYHASGTAMAFPTTTTTGYDFGVDVEVATEPVSGTIKLKKMVLSGASAEKSVVTAVIKLKKMVVSASGSVGSGGTGSIGIKLKKMILSGASAEKSVATAAIKLKKMVVSGTGVLHPPPTVVTTSLANAPQNVQIQRCLTASANGGAGGPYTWAVSSGSLPAGLSLSSDGTISGAATGGTGLSTFSVRATDSASIVSSPQSLGLTVVSAPFSPTGPSSSGGVDTWSITSAINGNTALSLTVCQPTAPELGYAHSFTIGLPVYFDDTYGNGLLQMQSVGIHNLYNTTIIYPTFPIEAWFADNPSNGACLEESFMLQVVAWAKANYATTGSEKVYLIGFSKSGNGGQQLLFRWPNIFAGVASYDAPMMMTDYDGTNPDGTTFGNPSSVYGTSDSYKANYTLSSANLAKWKAASNFGTVNRIWIDSWHSFEIQMGHYDTALTNAGIQHTYRHVGEDVHAWAASPDWTGPGILALVGTALFSYVTGAIKLKKMRVSGASAEKTVVTGAVKLKKMRVSGASAEKTVGASAIKLKKMVIAGQAALGDASSVKIKLKKMVLSGAISDTSVVTCVIKCKKMVLTGTSHEKTVATGVIVLHKQHVRITGTTGIHHHPHPSLFVFTQL